MFEDISKKTVSVVILIGIAVFFTGRFIWQKYDTGSLTITVAPTYSFAVDTSDAVTCPSNSCTLTLRSGEHPILITKDGFINFFTTVTVTRGQMTPFSPTLQRVPKIETRTTSKYVPPKNVSPFSLSIDKNSRQVLMNKADVVAYFARPFNAPIISSDASGKFVWVVDQKKTGVDGSISSIYLVNTAEKSRSVVYTSSSEIRGIFPSPNGALLAIVLPDELDMIDHSGAITAKVLASSLNEKSIAWQLDTVMYFIDHVNTGDILKRAELSSTGKIAPNALSTISTWTPDKDVIDFMAIDQTSQEIRIQGKKTAYAMKL